MFLTGRHPPARLPEHGSALSSSRASGLAPDPRPSSNGRTSLSRRRASVQSGRKESLPEILSSQPSAGFSQTAGAARAIGAIPHRLCRLIWKTPIVVVMDINMPVLDGIEAARLLRALAEMSDITIVAHAGNPGGLEGPLATLTRVLPKSAAPTSLVAAVLEIIVPA
jgi:CheY-like chemotaxis protein